MCNRNTTLYSDCRPTVDITSTASTPYEAGDQLTCVGTGSPTYEWSGTNGGISFTDSSSTVTLEGGEFCLVCTATVNSDPDCSARAFLCDSAYGKCQRQHNNLVTIVILMTLSPGYLDCYYCLRIRYMFR